LSVFGLFTLSEILYAVSIVFQMSVLLYGDSRVKFLNLRYVTTKCTIFAAGVCDITSKESARARNYTEVVQQQEDLVFLEREVAHITARLADRGVPCVWCTVTPLNFAWYNQDLLN
jgi:hypothetical protein